MWEIPIYLIGAPLLTLIVTLYFTLKLERYVLGSFVVVFVLLNIPTVIIPIFYPIGWEAMLGWASVYTVVSAIIGWIGWVIKRNKRPNEN